MGLGRMNEAEFSMKLSMPISDSPAPRFLDALRCRWFLPLALAWAVTGRVPTYDASAGPSLVAPGEHVADRRLDPPKDLDGYFPFTPPESAAEWTQKSARVRQQILTTLGLWPMPTRTPLNPVIHGRVDREEYTVEKVFFESMPGFYVTGNLYRPKGRTGKNPAVLFPHGHWQDGRFYDNPKVRQEIANGEERFEQGGRSLLQALCVQLARMGCVVFHYDMLGYADSQQISMGIAHGFARQRPEMNTAENWGLFSPAAESHFQSVMGLQTVNCVRALDFIESLPDVDPSRIGVTGASGGGTQTFILGAIDPRPAVAFPAVMVGTAMQGGCSCENACGLRVDTGNVEFAALFAPKPLGMTGANDWTREMATKGYPELRQLYGLLGKPDAVAFKAFNHFGHNYNAPSRCVMYSWMNKHLKLGWDEPVIEKDYQLLTTREMSVWDAAHPQPEGGPAFEKKLLRWWKEDADTQLAKAAADPAQFREVYGKGVESVIGRRVPAAGDVSYEQTYKEDAGSYWALGGILKESRRQESTPIVFYYPKEWKGRVVIWVHPQGKAGLCDPSSGNQFKPNAELLGLLSEGAAVATLDLVHQGDLSLDGRPLELTPKVKNSRELAAYTLCYNSSVFASRVHDLLRVVSFVKHHERAPRSIEMVGLGGAGHWVAAARAISGDLISKTVVDSQGFRFGQVNNIRHPDLLPGGAKYGDLPGMLALGAPGKLLVAGEPESSLSFVRGVYQRAGNADALTSVAQLDFKKAMEWLSH